MHKLLIGILFSLTLLVIGVSPVAAAGQYCCPNPFQRFDAASRTCIGNISGNTVPTLCLSNENCVSTGLNTRGICSEGTTTQRCCGLNQRYNYSTNMCGVRGPQVEDNCADDESCAYNFCVKGVVMTDPEFNICRGIADAAQQEACANCLGDQESQDNSGSGIWTALGCIHTDPRALVSDFLKIALGIAGGLALLLMVYGSFLITISSGDPKKAQEGREVIQGAIAGLLFIIFSVVLLRFIGVDILSIPGL